MLSRDAAFSARAWSTRESVRSRRRSSSSECARCDARVGAALLFGDLGARLIELGSQRVDLGLRGSGRADRRVFTRAARAAFLHELLLGARERGIRLDTRGLGSPVRLFERGALLRRALAEVVVALPVAHLRVEHHCDPEPEREALRPRGPERRRVEREVAALDGRRRHRRRVVEPPRREHETHLGAGDEPLHHAPAERPVGHQRPPQLTRRGPGEHSPAVETVERAHRGRHVADLEVPQHVGRDLDQRQQHLIRNCDVDTRVHVGQVTAHTPDLLLARARCSSRVLPRTLRTRQSLPEREVGMQAQREDLTLDTRGDCDTIDVTEHAQKFIANAGLRDGLCTVFVAHSTCAVTTIEFEPGCNADLARVMEQVAPTDDAWEHNERNADTNGHSHVRAAMMGPSVTVPFADGELLLGVWQKIVCIDFDDRPRQRRLVVQLLGI